MLLFSCVPVSESGGGGQGLSAKNSSGKKKSADASVSGKSKRSTSSKQSSKKKSSATGMYQSTATMYKCDGTVRTSKTQATTGGLSFAGKSLSADGQARKVNLPDKAMPVMATLVDKAIGGAVAFSQLDPWTDNGLNKRASCDLWVTNGTVLGNGNLECRPSTQNPRILVISLGLSPTFTNPDSKLEYLLERVGEAYHCNGDRNACLRILQNHPRYVSAKVNLKALLGHNNRSFTVEHRITAPFDIDDTLVTKEEDPIFYGYCMQENEETGETHIYFELKEKGKPFTPVTVDGGVSSFGAAHMNTPTNKKSMFGHFNMDSIPENITFASPAAGRHRQHEEDSDDDSTIATREQHGHGYKTTGDDKQQEEEDDDDDDEDSWDSNLMDCDEESKDSEVETLRKQVEELKNIVTGMYQKSTSKDSNDNSTSRTSVSTTKKAKRNNGSAVSVTDSKASRRSSTTRGTTAREDKRKTSPAVVDPDKKAK